jgi:DNA-binding CsgD family transcriptional regulator
MPMLREPAITAQARRLEGAVQFRSGTGVHALSTTLQAASAMYPFDPSQARQTVLDALQMSIWFGRWAPARPYEVARVAATMHRPLGQDPTSWDLLFDGIVAFYLSGAIVASPILRRALTAFLPDESAREVPSGLSFAAWAAFALGDNDALRVLAEEFIAQAREGGLHRLPEALSYAGLAELRVGTLARADVFFAEEGDVRQWGQATLRTTDQVLTLAWRGDEATTRETAAKLLADADNRCLGYTAARVAAAMAILEIGCGNYAAAIGGDVDGWEDDIAFGPFIAADCIEAHVRSGRSDGTAVHLALLDERAEATDMPLERGLAARSRALLSPDDDAERHHGEALTRLAESGGSLHLARAHLLYGEWLRRQKRRRDAREQLRAAHELFESMGAHGFAERARVELLATGETARKRVDETRNDLTPQELQISMLAAGGATNAEIAAQLFISASTVDYHLRKVFRKLGITSRRALTRAIAG